MKGAMGRWQLRWFVALWVFFGILMGFGLGVAYSFVISEGFGSGKGIDFFWIGLVAYLIVAVTLGRAYRRLVYSLK